MSGISRPSTHVPSLTGSTPTKGSQGAESYQKALEMKGVDSGTAKRVAEGSMAGASKGALNPKAKGVMGSAFKKDFAKMDSGEVRKAVYSSETLSTQSMSDSFSEGAAAGAMSKAAPTGGLKAPSYPGSASSAAARGGGGFDMEEEEELQM